MSTVGIWDADAVQRELYQRAGLDPDEPANMLALAKGLGLEVAIMHPARFPGDGALVRTYDRWRIFIRGRIDRERKRFALAHEIAEWALRSELDECIEDACDVIAGALIAPGRPFAARRREVGHDWEQLALPFGMTQSSAVLRVGETGGPPLALVAKIVRVRGPESFMWPDVATLRRWAIKPPPGLAKTRLTDDRTRTALLAEQLEFLETA